MSGNPIYWTEVSIAAATGRRSNRRERSELEIDHEDEAWPAAQLDRRGDGEAWDWEPAEGVRAKVMTAPSGGRLVLAWAVDDALVVTTAYLPRDEPEGDKMVLDLLQAGAVEPHCRARGVGAGMDLYAEPARPLALTIVHAPPMPPMRMAEAMAIIGRAESAMAAAYFRRALGA